MGQNVFGDADAVIFYGACDEIVLYRQAGVYVSALFSIGHRVGKEVCQHADEECFIYIVPDVRFDFLVYDHDKKVVCQEFSRISK